MDEYAFHLPSISHADSIHEFMCLFSAYPIVLIGKADSPEDAPFSIAPFLSCCDSGVSSPNSSSPFIQDLALSGILLV